MKPSDRIGILGGTRFIGYHLVEGLIQAGVRPLILHRGITREPQVFSGPVDRMYGDRDNPASLEAFFRKELDAVIDISGYTPGQIEPLIDRWAPRIGHYIFCSTSSVYQAPPSSPFDEAAPLLSQAGTYGGDKVLAERILLARWHQRGWPVTIFRPQGVFGPFDAEQSLYVVRRLLADRPILLRPGASGKKINFLWVEDFVRCILHSLRNPISFGQTFNAAGSETATPEQFAGILQSLIGADVPPKILSINEAVAAALPELGLPWLPYDLVAENKKIMNVLKVDFTPLGKSLEYLWQWAQTKPRTLNFREQRGEREALEGRLPSRWKRLSWSVYDGFRRSPLLSRWAGPLKRLVRLK